MHNKNRISLTCITMYGIILVGILFCALKASDLSIARAQEATTPTPNDYYSVNKVALADGTAIEEMIINGPPVPPPGYEIQRQAVSLPEILSSAGINILQKVPAFNWEFGCSAVSGAMIAGYYDNNGYPNMYTGPTNGSVMPMDNSSWPTWWDGYAAYRYPSNPLIASKLGLDGRPTRGSIDDYWVQYGSSAPDPYITGGWTQHTWGDAIGDYMLTSQSAYNLGDAYTRFYDNINTNGVKLAPPLKCASIEAAGYVDGTVGRKQFYQAKGYSITDCYNQFTDNQVTGGFSFAQYKAEIDAGRPVMINLAGHTIVGVGYADPDTIYIHDTWDNLTHAMTWGGSYSGMVMVAVSIVNLAPANYSIVNVTKAGTGSGTVTSSPAGINCGSNCTYAYDKNTTVTLTASASTGSAFTGWSGGGCSGTGVCVVTMSSAQSITATFTLPDLTITNLTVLPLSPYTSDDIHVSVDVANLTGADSTTFRIEFYVDDTWRSCWYLGLGNPPSEYFARVSSLAGNSNGSWMVTIPAGTLSAGTHTISAYVDMGCEVAEGIEANNNSGPVTVTVSIPFPGAFNLSSPANTAINQPANPTLSWGASSGATSYEYCLDTTNDNACNATWISTAASTSVALSGLTPGTNYYWQVRARNSTGLTYANGGNDAWFSFTVVQINDGQIFMMYLPLVTSGN